MRHEKRAKAAEPEELKSDASPPQTPFERFEEFARKVLSVPKAEIDRRDLAYRKERKRPR